jgi:acyl-CoA synthetase (AMP-forming)/AMP-acid ligase II
MRSYPLVSSNAGFIPAAPPAVGEISSRGDELWRGSETDEAELREFVRAKIASYKVPKQIVLVDEVRRAANGKPDYGWARKIIEAALA